MTNDPQYPYEDDPKQRRPHHYRHGLDGLSHDGMSPMAGPDPRREYSERMSVPTTGALGADPIYLGTFLYDWHGLDPDAPDPADVQAIASLNGAIHEEVETFIAIEWAHAEPEARRIYEEYLRS